MTILGYFKKPSKLYIYIFFFKKKEGEDENDIVLL
jgi:hypothetical protein